MQREATLLACFAISLLLGLGVFLGWWPIQASGTGCKAICGWTLLFTEMLGDRAAM